MESLDSLLRRAMHRCAYKDRLTFLPDDELGRLMTPDRVLDYLSRSEHEELRSDCSQITEHVCGPSERHSTRGTSRRIFAILLIIREPSMIVDVFRGGITDSDLPFVCVDSDVEEYLLARNTSSGPIRIQSFSRWSYLQRFTFYSNQWRVQVPVFLKGDRSLSSHPVHRLHSDIVFPWTDYEQVYDKNSEVVRVRIHKAHCWLGAGGNHSFALKSLKPLRSEKIATDAEFRLEVKALLKVTPRPHLEVDLITTFEHDKRYHLLFRWANGGNLDDLWRERHPRPEVTYKWICWLAQQCRGLAYGLAGIHDTKLAENGEAAQAYLELGPGASVEDDDGRNYGRHGDIKPQNVLWFEQDENEYGLGELKLSDFGLTTFHGALTTKVTPKDIRVTPTYSAPEREIDEKLSRPFDIWSLGCIFLEFVTWILLGVEGLDKFGDKRLLDAGSRDQRFSLDNFYMIIREDGKERAEVKKSVYDWIASLKAQRKCSPFLSEFLSYIQERLLLVDREDRDKSGDVIERLDKMFTTCEHNPSYALYRGSKELERNNQSSMRKRTVNDFGHDDGNSGGAYQGSQGQTKRTRKGRK